MVEVGRIDARLPQKADGIAAQVADELRVTPQRLCLDQELHGYLSVSRWQEIVAKCPDPQSGETQNVRHRGPESCGGWQLADEGARSIGGRGSGEAGCARQKIAARKRSRGERGRTYEVVQVMGTTR